MELTGRRKWLPLVTVCLGSFMLLVDVTIVNVALPDMARDLKTSFGSLQWVVDAYALALASLVLGMGSIADQFGHRRAYVVGLILFALSSLVCGVSPNAAALITARAIQGIGGALMFATTAALLNSNYSGRDRGTAYGLWGAVLSASAAVGPIVGGVLTELLSWRWIFFVNLPVSVVAVALCVLGLADVHAPVKGRIDFAGMAAFTATAGSLTYGLIRANEDGWSGVGTWGWLVATPFLLGVFLLVESRASRPMIDLSLLRNRFFGGVLFAGVMLSFAAFGSYTYVSIWLQSVLGMSPIEAGLTGLPVSISSFFVAAGIGKVLHRVKPGPVIGGGLLLIGLGGVVGGLLLHGSATWPELIPGFTLIGVGVGLMNPMLNSAAMGAVPPQRGGMAGGALNTGRQLGLALGIAALGSVFAARAAHVLQGRGVPGADAVSRAVAGGQAPILLQRVPAATRAAMSSDFHAAGVAGIQWTMLVSGLAGVAAALLVLVLLRPGRAARASAAEAPVEAAAAH